MAGSTDGVHELKRVIAEPLPELQAFGNCQRRRELGVLARLLLVDSGPLHLIARSE